MPNQAVVQINHYHPQGCLQNHHYLRQANRQEFQYLNQMVFATLGPLLLGQILVHLDQPANRAM